MTGDWHRMLDYRSRAERLDSANPPLWRNSVRVFNYCTYFWDQLYSHEYRANQANCFDASVNCAWWAAIEEAIPQTEWYLTTPISKVGYMFLNLDVLKAGEPDVLFTPEDTDWTEPPAMWQTEEHLSPNGAYGLGTYLDSDGDGVWDWSDPDDDQDGYTDVAESGAPLCSGSVNDDGAVDSGETAVNDGCPAVGAPEAVCGVANDEDSDGFVNDGCPQVGSWSEGQFNIGTMSVGRCSYITDAPSRVWPSDLVFGGFTGSTERVDIADLNSFLSPRRLDTNPGDALFDKRWDLDPGSGIFATFINIGDLTALLGGPTGSPPMLGGEQAFNGPSCPW